MTVIYIGITILAHHHNLQKPEVVLPRLASLHAPKAERVQIFLGAWPLVSCPTFLFAAAAAFLGVAEVFGWDITSSVLPSMKWPRKPTSWLHSTLIHSECPPNSVKSTSIFLFPPVLFCSVVFVGDSLQPSVLSIISHYLHQHFCPLKPFPPLRLPPDTINPSTHQPINQMHPLHPPSFQQVLVHFCWLVIFVCAAR